MRFRNKAIFITGSTKRTGYGIAEAFIDEGADVYINGRSADLVYEVTANLSSRNSGRAIPLPGDITNPDEVQNMFSQIESVSGNLNVLINNTSQKGRGYSFLETPLKEWEAVMAVNLTGMFLCCHNAARLMMNNFGGSIINMGSLTAASAIRNRVAYITSKGGIESFTRALSLELADFKITVNTLAPEYFIEESLDQIPKGHVQQRTSSVSYCRKEDISEVARLALFLASPESGYITGQTITINGRCPSQILASHAEFWL